MWFIIRALSTKYKNIYKLLFSTDDDTAPLLENDCYSIQELDCTHFYNLILEGFHWSIEVSHLTLGGIQL